MDNKIDAKRSYHFFSRKRSGMSEQEIQEEEELAREVDKLVRHHYMVDETKEVDEEQRHRYLRSGADDTNSMVSDRVKNLLRRYPLPLSNLLEKKMTLIQ